MNQLAGVNNIELRDGLNFISLSLDGIHEVNNQLGPFSLIFNLTNEGGQPLEGVEVFVQYSRTENMMSFGSKTRTA